jgi:hypothetical protein
VRQEQPLDIEMVSAFNFCVINVISMRTPLHEPEAAGLDPLARLTPQTPQVRGARKLLRAGVAAAGIALSIVVPTAMAGETITIPIPAGEVQYDPDNVMEITLDQHSSSPSFRDQLKARLKAAGQLPKDPDEAKTMMDGFMAACAQLNSHVDFAQFRGVHSDLFDVPGKVTIVKRTDAFFPADAFHEKGGWRIIVPDGVGFLWIERVYGPDEKTLRALNPQLEGRDLHSGEELITSTEY